MRLTPEQSDAIAEIINIGIGRAAGSLSEIVQCHVALSVPSIKIEKLSEFIATNKHFGLERYSSVRLDFTGFTSGTAALVFPADSALNLVSVLTGDEMDTLELDSVRAGTLTEVGNVLLNSVVGTLGNILKSSLGFGLPSYTEDIIEVLMGVDESTPDPEVLVIKTSLGLKDLRVVGDILMLFKVGSLESLLQDIRGLDMDE